MARVINTGSRVVMDAEKYLRGRQGVLWKGPVCHAKEFEVYTLGQSFTPLATYRITYGAFKKILITTSHLGNGVRMSGSGARYWAFIKSFVGDSMCSLI